VTFIHLKQEGIEHMMNDQYISTVTFFEMKKIRRTFSLKDTTMIEYNNINAFKLTVEDLDMEMGLL